MSEKITTVFQLYQHLDELFDLDSDTDTLFASGYLRGFISLAASQFGDESQVISSSLIDSINDDLVQSKSELSPQDGVIVHNFWLNLQDKFAL